MTQIKETLLERYKLTQEIGILNTPVTSKEAELGKTKRKKTNNNSSNNKNITTKEQGSRD